MSDIHEVNDFLGYMLRGDGQPSHSKEEMQELSQLIIDSAREQDRVLKPKTAKLAHFLQLDIPHDQKREAYQILSSDSGKILTQYGATSRDQKDGFISRDSAYRDIANRLTRRAKSVEQIRDAKERELMAKSCVMVQKPVYYGMMPTLYDSNMNQLETSDLKNGKRINIDGHFDAMGLDSNNLPAPQSPSNVQIKSFYTQDNGGWMIETPDSIYTNIDFSKEYNKVLLEERRNQLEAERRNDREFMSYRKEAISTMSQVALYTNEISKSNYGAWLSQFGGTLNWPMDDIAMNHIFATTYDSKAADRINESALILACVESNIPIIQTDRSQDVDFLVDYKAPDADLNHMNFITELPVPGETITLPPNSQFLGTYKGYEDLLPKTECTVLEVVGSPDNYVILTDAGLLTSRNFELVLERMIGGQEQQFNIGQSIEEHDGHGNR